MSPFIILFTSSNAGRGSSCSRIRTIEVLYPNSLSFSMPGGGQLASLWAPIIRLQSSVQERTGYIVHWSVYWLHKTWNKLWNGLGWRKIHFTESTPFIVPALAIAVLLRQQQASGQLRSCCLVKSRLLSSLVKRRFLVFAWLANSPIVTCSCIEHHTIRTQAWRRTRKDIFTL